MAKRPAVCFVRTLSALLAGAVMLTLGIHAHPAEPTGTEPSIASTGGETPSAPQGPTAISVSPASPATPSTSVVATKKSGTPQIVRPLWSELTKGQQEALAPLAARWPEINDIQKRKWLALSHNFKSLSAEEKDKLHARMTEWTALTVQERVQARINYAQANKLAPEDKKAQWEAYQALSTDEKHKLAQKAPTKPVGAAVAIKPTPAEKLAPVPTPKANTPRPIKIEVGPHQLDPHTLLPLVQAIGKNTDDGVAH